MSLEAIYFIGQTIAAAAVVASLLIVAFQLREGNRSNKLARQYEFIEASMSAYDPIYREDSDEILRKGLAADPDMDEREKFVFNILMGRIMMVPIFAMQTVDSKALRQSDAEFWAYTWYRGVADTPGGRNWLKANQQMKAAEKLADYFEIDLTPTP